MIKEIKKISVSDLNKLALIFENKEIENYGIILGDKVEFDFLLEEK